MDEKELRAFISQIIASGNHYNIALSLAELRHILEREEAEQSLLDLLEQAVDADLELAQLGMAKRGNLISKDELGKALREGYERNRRRGC